MSFFFLKRNSHLLYGLFIVSAIMFFEGNTFPEFFTINQAKELFHLFNTTTCGLIAIYIALIFSSFNTKNPVVLKILSQNFIAIFFIAILLSVSLLLSTYGLILVISTNETQVPSFMIVQSNIPLLLSLVWVLTLIILLVSGAVREIGMEQLMDTYKNEFDIWKNMKEEKYKQKLLAEKNNTDHQETKPH